MQRFIFILIAAIVFAACQSDKQQGNASFDRDIKVFRYDRLQYEATALNSFSALQRMNLDCPRATKILIEDVLGLGRVDDPEINDKLCAYYSDSILLRIMRDVGMEFKDMSDIEEGLTKGFRQLKEEFPSIVVPQVYSQVSALNQSVVVGDSLLGISLDKYLGADYPLYQRYYYGYQRRFMERSRILPDCFTFYLLSQYPFQWRLGRRTLLDVIMYQGKINLVVREILNIKSNEEMLGYTQEETDWCRKNKGKLWKWMMVNGHLSTTDPMVIRAYTHADPTMVFNGEKIPPTIGIWLGMQLVEKFLNGHPEMSLEELMHVSDFGVLDID
ncbi:gliding motility lipoprotein GldB [uncultured Bacteroides sp.]|jgi:hypothetical protein|uniref:gliding motility protein GldB-related protein n=1 Tax=uncultured Bacteroides sp. TaxID=162156 RepID=UPI00280B1359|nr:gliding motility lipoprotein GldB [uncultured Bacteroides sp.]